MKHKSKEQIASTLIHMSIHNSNNTAHILLPKEAPSNKMFPSVILAKPAANPTAAIIKLAKGIYLIILGACN